MQVIPHITDEIKARIRAMAEPGEDGNAPDVVITEIGGTVGDIESLPFLEAARQVRHDVGRDNCFFLHVSLVPYLAPSGELKTKPTQHSVAALRNIGIQPDAVVCRADREIPSGLKRKIALMCDVDIDAVVAAPDAPSIYDIPKVLHTEGLDAYVVRRLGLPFRDVDWTVWGDLLSRVHNPKETVRIAIVGKYVDLPDAYLSVTEALRAGGFAHRAKVEIVWVASDTCETPAGAAAALSGLDGVLIPGGFGVRGIEGKIGAIQYARDQQDPACSGLCLGLQCMVIETARQPGRHRGRELLGVRRDHQAPGDLHDGRPGGRRRRRAGHGRHDAARRLPGEAHRRARWSRTPTATREVSERHRHRYEVNNAYRAKLSKAGLVFSGLSPDGHLVEFVELPADVHPFFVGTQAHPELKSRPTRPHPLFAGFVRAALATQGGRAAAGGAAGAVRCGGAFVTRARSARLRRTVHMRTSTSDGSSRVRVDDVAMPGGGQAKREVVEHHGAVAIVALDDDDQVTLIHQYRHPLGRRIWELPAGLIDHLGEDPLESAKRELVEEVGLAAEDWSVLVDVAASPGFTDEVVRVYLATGLSTVDRELLGDEEADLVARKVPARRGRPDGAGRRDRQRRRGRRPPRRPGGPHVGRDTPAAGRAVARPADELRRRDRAWRAGGPRSGEATSAGVRSRRVRTTVADARQPRQRRPVRGAGRWRAATGCAISSRPDAADQLGLVGVQREVVDGDAVGGAVRRRSPSRGLDEDRLRRDEGAATWRQHAARAVSRTSGRHGGRSWKS